MSVSSLTTIASIVVLVSTLCTNIRVRITSYYCMATATLYEYNTNLTNDNSTDMKKVASSIIPVYRLPLLAVKNHHWKTITKSMNSRTDGRTSKLQSTEVQQCMSIVMTADGAPGSSASYEQVRDDIVYSAA